MSYFELMGFGPKGWGWPMLMAAGMTVAVASCGFLVGAILGSLIAWAKLSRSLILRSLGDGYTTVLRGIPDLLVIYLFYFGGSAVLSRVGQWFGGSGGFVSVPAFAVGALAIGVISAAYQAEVFRGAYTALARGEIEAAKSVGMHRHAAVPAHHRAAGAALRDPGPRQRLAAGAQGIGADLGHRPRRAACASRRSAPARPTSRSRSTSRRRCSTSSSPRSRPGASSAPRTTRCAA